MTARTRYNRGENDVMCIVCGRFISHRYYPSAIYIPPQVRRVLESINENQMCEKCKENKEEQQCLKPKNTAD